jgi:hypothetical protein
MREEMLGYLISNMSKDKVAVHVVKPSPHDQEGVNAIFGVKIGGTLSASGICSDAK